MFTTTAVACSLTAFGTETACQSVEEKMIDACPSVVRVIAGKMEDIKDKVLDVLQRRKNVNRVYVTSDIERGYTFLLEGHEFRVKSTRDLFNHVRLCYAASQRWTLFWRNQIIREHISLENHGLMD